MPRFPKDKDPVKFYSAIIASTEVGLGSLLHAFHIPFAGHILSLNQGAMLTAALKKCDTQIGGVRVVNQISGCVSLLKSLSPAGKKLTPMLAISMQGLLYSLGIMIFGPNIIGVTLAMVLLSVWAFAQPIIVYYLLFGQELFAGVTKLWTETAAFFDIPVDWGFYFLCSVVVVKIFVAIGIGILFWISKESLETKYVQKLKTVPKLNYQPSVSKSAFAGALRDLLNPWFLFSVFLSVGYVAFYENSEHLWIYLLRPIALGLVFFWIVRLFPKSISNLN